MRPCQAHILIRLRHSAGIDSTCRPCAHTGRAHKVIDRQRLVRNRGGCGRNRLHVRGFVSRCSAGCSTHGLVAGSLCHDVVLLTIAAPSAVSVPCAHPMQRRWTTRIPLCGVSRRCRLCRTAAGLIMFSGCRFVGSAAANAVSMRAHGLGAWSCSVSRCAIGVVRSSHLAHAQRMRCRHRQTARKEHREAQRKAQHSHDCPSARGSLRARVVLSLAEPPLRHHHHNLYKVAAKPPSLFRLSSSTSAR